MDATGEGQTCAFASAADSRIDSLSELVEVMQIIGTCQKCTNRSGCKQLEEYSDVEGDIKASVLRQTVLRCSQIAVLCDSPW
ncbi:hypothetical protein Efla_002955 [Eimeria flavescens]